jgi:hypothetical protein
VQQKPRERVSQKKNQRKRERRPRKISKKNQLLRTIAKLRVRKKSSLLILVKCFLRLQVLIFNLFQLRDFS